MKRKATAKPNLDAAWDAFFASQKLDDPKKLRAAGWRMPEDLAAPLGLNINAARQTCIRAVESRAFESKKFRIVSKRGLREVTFYRPLTR